MKVTILFLLFGSVLLVTVLSKSVSFDDGDAEVMDYEDEDASKDDGPYDDGDDDDALMLENKANFKKTNTKKIPFKKIKLKKTKPKDGKDDRIDNTLDPPKEVPPKKDAMSQGVLATLQGWQNRWRSTLNVHCGSHDGFYHVYAHYNRGQGDRLWQWRCRRATAQPFSHCYWSGYENARGGDMDFSCPSNQILRGVNSVYMAGMSDRRWKFLCCKAPRYYTYNCYTSEWANTGEENIYHVVGQPRVFTGMVSVYDHEKRDRMWKVKVCEFGTLMQSHIRHQMMRP